MAKMIVKKPGEEMRVVDFDGKYRCDVKPLLGEDVTLQYVDLRKDAGDTYLSLVCDDDGKLKRLPFNFYLPTQYGLDDVVGTVCFVRYQWENPWEKNLWDFQLVDLTDNDIKGISSFLSVSNQMLLQRKLTGDTPNISEYAVGKTYPQFKDEPDGYRLEFDGNSLWLYVLMRGWTARERKAVSTDQPVALHFTQMNGVGFLCVKFGTMPWGDCPFHPALYREHGIAVENRDFGEHDGIPLTVVGADTATGKVLILRLIGLGNRFSKEWTDWAVQHYNDDMPRADYQRRVDEVYQAITSEELAAISPCRWNLQV